MKKLHSNVEKPAFQAHSYWEELPPTRMIFLRHGETDWNVRRVIQGWRGTGLNPMGLKQAGLAAARLKKMGIQPEAILVSDLRRARQTAQAVGKALKIQVHEWKEWRERNFGDWEGKSVLGVLKKFSLGSKQRVDPFMAFDPKGGESMQRFEKRIAGALKRVETEFRGKTVIVVTHGGPVRIAACLAAGIPSKKYFLLGRPGNVSLTTLQSQGGVRWIEGYNDIAHLEKNGR